MKLAVCTAKYSDNLGDGVISDCQRYLMNSPGVETKDIDIAGRSEYSDSSSRGSKKRAFYRLPVFLRRLAVLGVWFAWRRHKALSIWREQLIDADALIFAGGQVLQDDLLNFPLKIHALIGLARGQGIPVSFLCVGVGSNWTPLGRWLVASALSKAPPVSISVRDRVSLENLKRLGCDKFLPDCRVSIDPAIFASEVYGPPAEQGVSIGLGVAHPSELKVGGGDAFPGEHFWREFWVRLATLLIERGNHVLMFTNGSAEDEDFLASIKSQLPRQVGVMSRPRRPSELARLIASMRLVVAHRLHALIISTSYSIPVVALHWDNKVFGFMDAMGMSDRVVCPADCDASLVASICEKAGSDLREVGLARERLIGEIKDLESMLRKNGED